LRDKLRDIKEKIENKFEVKGKNLSPDFRRLGAPAQVSREEFQQHVKDTRAQFFLGLRDNLLSITDPLEGFLSEEIEVAAISAEEMAESE
jgi:hypothetical protein